ncbi:MAG: phage integrase SAM-like domain-containing protein, partial [Dysgonamonadaceae bacterium]|nr:phage integrase SAM-like domain-containing protein [Dysgonamonadaceae bacterium]
MRTNKFHFPLSCYFRKNEPPDVDQPSFIDIAEALSQELKANGKDRTAKLYLMVAGCLTRFAGNNKLMLEDITPALLCRYDGYLLKLGRKPNTISSHMRNLRAIYNKAVRRGVIPPPQENLFSDVHTGTYPTLKRALNKEEMQALSNLADNGSDDGLDNGLDNG